MTPVFKRTSKSHLKYSRNHACKLITLSPNKIISAHHHIQMTSIATFEKGILNTGM